MRSVLLVLVLSASAWAGGPVIVIDPGHGGEQDGAASPAGLLEKNIALALTRKLKAQLETDLGATVRLTRDKDALLGLQERVDIANKLKPALFISLHANSMPTKAQRQTTYGIETYFLSAASSGEQARKVAARENAEAGGAAKGPSGDTLSFILADLQTAETHKDSSRLAYAVHEAVIAQTQAFDRGVQQAPFYVLMGLQAPAVLVEIGFISHPEESKKLADAEYQQKLAVAISAGVKQFLEQLEARDGKHEGGSGSQ